MFSAKKAIISAFIGPQGANKLPKWLLLQKCVVAPGSSASPFTSSAVRPQIPPQDEHILNGVSSQYYESMYDTWLADPSSVHVSWASYFRNSSFDDKGHQSPPSLVPLGKNEIYATSFAGVAAVHRADVTEKVRYDDMALQAIIISYQSKGHYIAKLDPLEINQGTLDGLKFTDYGFEHADLDRVFYLPPNTFIGGNDRLLPLREILRRLESTYCGHIAAEFMHMKDKDQCSWIRQRLETPEVVPLTIDEKKILLARLMRATEFESFLARKWPTEKRFGLEGCEALIPAMKQIIDKSTEFGVDSFVIGMPHRGRLNVLANVCRQPLDQMFALFGGLKGDDERSGDVKYHLGTYIERLNRVTNKNIRMALLANPSHLEAVNPVVQGRTRAEQFCRGDDEGKKVLSILLHGDAAFSGQGVVTESINLSNLPNYTNHGTIHIIANNQIGFTTDPCHSRSSIHCTANGRVVDAPIFHVNADDPESVMKVCNMAVEWRNTFHKDVFIDLVGYRRNGHNEIDEPMFTQPLMYRKIKKTKPVVMKYAEKLIDEGVMTQEEVEGVKDEYEKICEKALKTARQETQVMYKNWSSDRQLSDPLRIGKTGLTEETLVHIGEHFSSPPPMDLNAGFITSRGIERILKGRMDMIKNRQIDWALGEALAFGSLLKEGIHVRLSGQDVERGTFSHRHHVLLCQNSNASYRPLSNLYPNQASYTVCNSPLSEYGVLGFELGYSVGNSNSLVMWEAQFGDFHNTAQAIIDQFISSGETKWGLQTSLVMLLPHGLDGMGSEHSSARLERFLQMSSDCASCFPESDDDFAIHQLRDSNWIVANCTTPANLFHILRRQIALPFRKPLILMTPKSLLRHAEARSSFDEILENTEFQRIIPDQGPVTENPDDVKKMVFCTGQVYYELKKARDNKELQKEIAITRIEQISPFPYDLVKTECAKYPNAQLCFAQEEHGNQGAWTYVQPRFATALSRTRDISYIGRPSASSTATGIKAQHVEESVDIMTEAMAL